ncbi:MAG: adenylate/guanylate cyclase domain-containing protein, partial [Pseudomonadota bacterium]
MAITFARNRVSNSNTENDMDPQDAEQGHANRRKLCVSFIDVAGFAAQMRADEEGTFHRWIDMRDNMVLPLLEQFNGEMVKRTGDGILATFEEAVSAVRWSAELQKRARQRRQGLALRVSLHYCSVLQDGQDMLGDGVNVAARLQEYAPVGGVVMTDTVSKQIADLPEFAIRSIGELILRKMGGRVKAYELITDGRPTVEARMVEEMLPSLAVIPFANIGGQ